MKHFVAVVSSPSPAHAALAKEALVKVALSMGHELKFEVNEESVLTPDDIRNTQAVILVADERISAARFAGKPVYATTVGESIRHTQGVIEAAVELTGVGPTEDFPASSPAKAAEPEVSPSKKLVAITACPTGIAHTFMAAEALQKAAKALGHEIKVETQGSVGAKNALTPEDVEAADAVVIAAETKVDLSRFAGKPIYSTSTKEAIHGGQEVLKKALVQPVDKGDLAGVVEKAKADRAKARTGPYKHLMTGVSYMLPLVIAGGLSIALAFAVGGIYAGDQKGTLAEALNLIGGGVAFQLFVAVFSGFIAFSIADRPGLAPGLIGGMLAQNLGAGFLGGIASGFLAGYLTKFLADKIRLPATLEGLKPVLILPFLSSILVGLAMIYVIAPPVQVVLSALTTWLQAMQGTNAVLLGIILGGMMAFDMGGPVNKAAYTFAVGLIASQVYLPMGAVMVAGMTPAIGVALAAWMFRNRFDAEEREAAGPAFVLGLSLITEGAIPFAAKDPVRVIPALVIGSALGGAVAMYFGVQFLVPHGGVFAAVIPGAVKHLAAFFGALVVGSLATAVALFILKRPITAQLKEAK